MHQCEKGAITLKPVVDAIDVDPKTGTTLGFYTFGEERPNVLVLSAMEGQSSGSVYTSFLIMKSLEEIDRIDGSLTFLPVANPLAFRLGMEVSPLDSQYLDTVFPGYEMGSVTERTAWEIWRKVVQADYVIHIKSQTTSCISHIHAMHRDYIHVRNFASQLGLPLVVQSSGRRGALITEAAHEGIPAVTVEIRGSRDDVDPQASVEVREVLLNFLRIKDMISGEKIDVEPKYAGRLQQVNASSEGFFVSDINPGETIETNAPIGRIIDREEIISPLSGTVVSLNRLNYVFEGDSIGRIAQPLVDTYTSSHEEVDEVPRRKW